jgi:hypothetical protein
MRRMTVKERLEDISRRTGLSEDIIRRVLLAERDSIVDSLKRGERSTLIGRCVLIPELRNKLGVGGKMGKTIRVIASVLDSLEAELRDLEGFENGEIDNLGMEDIRLLEISSLL